MQNLSSLTYSGYSPGHPWYYFLGGNVRTLKQIREDTRRSGYKGYLADEIAKLDRKSEPHRSAALRSMHAQVMKDLKRDVSGYRKCALRLCRHPKLELPLNRLVSSDDIHTNISLKHNHLVNDFAHLITLDHLLNRQGDLFGG